MVANCVNPTCNRQFRELSKGRLFLLPPTRGFDSPQLTEKLSDHCYWLCPECDLLYTVTRQGSKVLVTMRDNPGDLAGRLVTVPLQ